jgi:5-methylthioadenosine/S-adenosylhomocysteine deaminase
VIVAADWVLPVSGPAIRGGAVEVEGDRIAWVGEAPEGVEPLAGHAILPGLVNAHTHLEYARMAGFGDGLPFTPWIEDHVRRRRPLDTADYLAQARAGATACLAGGTTTVGDCAWDGAALAAIADAGLRAIVYLEAFSHRPAVVDEIARRLDAATAVVERTGGRVATGVSPHAPYTVNHDDFRALVALARERGAPVATHLLESDRESTHVDAFADVLGADTLAVHAVKVTPADVALLAELDVPVVHCPRSNALLGCGVAPVAELAGAGVRVGLGTDSPASALTFDMWEEMRAAILLARARAGRPDALTAREALRMATLGGAEALGLAGVTGSLEPGKAADLTIVDLRGSAFLPWDEPAAAVVYGGSPERVVLTLVAGEVRYKGGGGPAGPVADPAADAARAKMIAD